MFSYILYKYTYMCVVECEPTFLENKVLFLFFFPTSVHRTNRFRSQDQCRHLMADVILS